MLHQQALIHFVLKGRISKNRFQRNISQTFDYLCFMVTVDVLHKTVRQCAVGIKLSEKSANPP